MNIEKQLLHILENKARTSASDLAKMLDADEETVLATLANLEARGVIAGYNAIIDWDKVEEEKVNALIEVKVRPQRDTGFDAVAKSIARFEEVDSIYLISGGYDLLVQIKGRSMKEISSFVFEKLSTLEAILSTATHFVLKKYKDHGTSLEEPLKDQRAILSI